MIRMNLALAALAFAFSSINTPSAMAWHLASKRACLKHASAPHCGPDANPSYSRSLRALLRFFRGMIEDAHPLCV